MIRKIVCASGVVLQLMLPAPGHSPAWGQTASADEAPIDGSRELALVGQLFFGDGGPLPDESNVATDGVEVIVDGEDSGVEALSDDTFTRAFFVRANVPLRRAVVPPPSTVRAHALSTVPTLPRVIHRNPPLCGEDAVMCADSGCSNGDRSLRRARFQACVRSVRVVAVEDPFDPTRKFGGEIVCRYELRLARPSCVQHRGARGITCACEQHGTLSMDDRRCPVEFWDDHGVYDMRSFMMYDNEDCTNYGQVP